MNNSINLASDTSLNIVTPLMFLDKSESWHLAYKLGNDKLIDIIIDDTHSCYRGIRNNKYEWGYGCNNCFACELRANGWLKYNELIRK
jgi:7-cyano-7-deazaguanine synthase